MFNRPGITVVFLLLQELSLAKRFYTRYNDLCISECTRHGATYYWCYTSSNPYSWDYCSPQPDVDIHNRPCLSICGKRKGKHYYWCEVEVNAELTWDYCGTHGENFRVVSSSGYFCVDACAKRSEQYYWCHTEQDWGYCSPKERTDHYGRRCLPDSYCDRSAGADYYWCYVGGGEQDEEWGYCSVQGESKHLTYRGYYCSTECQYDATSDYSECNIYDGTIEYCSQLSVTDSRGHVCSYTKCSRPEEKTYFWCYYEDGQWDYCGLLSPDENYDVPSQFTQHTTLEPSSRKSYRKLLSQTTIGGKTSVEEVIDDKVIFTAKSAILQLEDLKYERNARTASQEGNVHIKLKGKNEKRRRFIKIKVEYILPGKHGILETLAEGMIQVNIRGKPLFPLRHVQHCLIASLMDKYKRHCRLAK